MRRRQFLLGLSATLLAARAGLSLSTPSDVSTEMLPLWPGIPPGGGGPTGPLQLSVHGAQRHIAGPFLTILTPFRANGHGVLVAPGGGYTRVEMAKEGWPAARWLVARGYTAYILSYRLPGEGWHDGSRVALQDAQRALRIIRQREKRVSVLGFSAGGHLLGMAATRAEERSYTPLDALDSLPARADGAALIYPIVTLEKPYSHTSTHRVLVGKNATQAQDAAWSVQPYVTPTTPPMFLVQAEDDSVSDPHNTLILQTACLRAGVSVEMHRYPSGGHGFGMGRAGTQTLAWPEQYEKWLRER